MEVSSLVTAFSWYRTAVDTSKDDRAPQATGPLTKETPLFGAGEVEIWIAITVRGRYERQQGERKEAMYFHFEVAFEETRLLSAATMPFANRMNISTYPKEIVGQPSYKHAIECVRKHEDWRRWLSAPPIHATLLQVIVEHDWTPPRFLAATKLFWADLPFLVIVLTQAKVNPNFSHLHHCWVALCGLDPIQGDKAKLDYREDVRRHHDNGILKLVKAPPMVNT